MNTKKVLSNTKGTTSSNPFWKTFDEVIASEKFDKMKAGGFEIINFTSTKNYQQKCIEVHYEILYPVEKGKWGVSRDYDLAFDADNISGLKSFIKGLRNEMKTQKILHRGLKKEECRCEPFKSAGWYIYYTS